MSSSCRLCAGPSLNRPLLWSRPRPGVRQRVTLQSNDKEGAAPPFIIRGPGTETWEGSYSLPGQKPPRLYWEMVIQLRLDASRSRELTTSPGSLGPGYSECGPLTKKLSSIKMQSPPPRPHPRMTESALPLTWPSGPSGAL